jgi:hypothetical protein
MEKLKLTSPEYRGMEDYSMLLNKLIDGCIDALSSFSKYIFKFHLVPLKLI